MDSKKLFDFGVELSKSIKRDNTIYGQETVTENAAIPEYEIYTGPLDKDGKIPYESLEDEMDREADEDRYCGGIGPNRRSQRRELEFLSKDERDDDESLENYLNQSQGE